VSFEKLQSIARTLESVTAELHDVSVGCDATRAAPTQSAGQIARRLLAERRAREKLLACDLLGEPAWDMLLDLVVCEEKGEQVSVSSLCIASCVPATTALRWIGALEARKLVCRFKDIDDGRRIYVQLTDNARATLTDYLLALS
jgi:DNA-binding MarR family transcriptional regulator